LRALQVRMANWPSLARAARAGLLEAQIERLGLVQRRVHPVDVSPLPCRTAKRRCCWVLSSGS
jgi:hypothetical protein